MYINFWYPICTTVEIDDQSPHQAEIFGIRLVAFRDSAGTAHVLSDTCVHRGGSLGKGKIVDDCIACPYHGWQYRGDGSCAKIPSSNGKKVPGRAKIDSYPVSEKYGIVFAFLGDLPAAERPPEPHVEEFEKEGWRTTGPLVFEINAYFERSVENGLDPIHNEYVHPAQGAPAVEEDRVEMEKSEWGSSFEVAFGAYKEESARQRVADTTKTEGLRAGSWHIGPNHLMTGIYLPENNHFVQYFFEQPISKKETRIFFVNARNNALDADKDDWINSTFMNIAQEDIAIIENLRPFGTPDTLTKELLTPGDAAVVTYRKYLSEWEQKGWRIDWQKLQNQDENVAYAIPSPARRESGNWVLDTVPVTTAAG